jgi:ureidoglycolate lyase
VSTALPLRELDASAFAPFGSVVEPPARAEDASGPGWRWWGETALLDAAPYGLGLLELEQAPLRFDWAERHMRSAELVVPLDADVALYAGPAEAPDDPLAIPPRERFCAFRVRAGQAALLAPGVWHGAPLALERGSRALVVLREGTGATDTAVVRFPEDPVTIDPGGRIRADR